MPVSLVERPRAAVERDILVLADREVEVALNLMPKALGGEVEARRDIC